ncbi:glycosyltransferase [Fictibacillus nanhaiensis]|uniref:glycosyltransferase family 2 protein n=1 Tax=Fictibacillus nanhaiensis TaxID=742169 RepID=UPI001C987FEE|nr:glycosyltransferase family 2 protein [Fictibacillus nanhaiensis]MBY6037582.1 glycosyltransferase [Fictibacillus nanhaiensis]
MIKLSIIIPSYNRYPLNLWSLYSLENQTISSDQVEILFIDDCSTDETPSLRHFESRYHFTYIRNSVNKGRAASRNIGVELARGEIILFLDSEMLTEPDFLENHMNHHRNDKSLVVSGTFYHKGVFTMYYPDFSHNQVNHIKHLAKHHSFPLRTLPESYPVPLIKKEDIHTSQFIKLSFPNPYFPEISETYGDELKGFTQPWTVFLSGNVSLQRELLLQTGGFDENFKGWGYEDWELGYRLYKQGAYIVSKSDIKAYHQEHPIPPNFIEKQMIPNFYYFQNKHSAFEVSIHALFLLGKINRVQESLIVKEYVTLIDEHPVEFISLLTLFQAGLEQIAAHLASVPINKRELVLNRRTIKQQKIKLFRMNKYHHFLDAFYFIENKIL